MAAIIPTIGHYYLLNMNFTGSATIQITNIISGNDGNTYYHVSQNGVLTWYSSNNLPSGFALEFDFGTTAPL